MPGAHRPEEVEQPMGQPIQVDATRLDDVVVFDTDRSITGQDGAGFGSAAEAEASGTLPAELAGRLFAADGSVNHVFVASNQVVVRRSGGWSDGDVDAASRVISDFFLFYPESTQD
jgi:hypothetical protein